MKNKIFIAVCTALIGLAAFLATANGATLVETDKMVLKNITYQIGGRTVICHWLENPKLLGGKVNTGLSCVVLDPVVVNWCDSHNHEHPQYQIRENVGLW